MRAFLRKYGVEIRLALIVVYAVGITWITWVKSGKIEAEINLLFYLVGGLAGAILALVKYADDARDDLRIRVKMLEHFVSALTKTNIVEPAAKKTEEKLPS